MRFLEYCRNKVYWAIDSLRGGLVAKYLDILKHCDDGSWSDSQIEQYQQNALEKLLSHTRVSVPCYSKMTSDNLCDWPVVNKSIIKESGDNAFSSEYKKEDLIIMSTSGSTGTPFRCYQNIEKKKHVNAEVMYYNGLIGYKVGRRIIYFRSIVGEVSKSRLAQFSQNIVLLDCGNLDDLGVEKKLEEIKKKTKHCSAMILSYASTLDAFRRYFQKYGYEKVKYCHIYGVVSGSEMLQDITRDTLSKAFNCKVVSRYANEENGFLGQDDAENNIFIPNRAHYYIEILKLDSNEVVEDGEVGRIVVTDLYNYAMPMIRYDTGDVGTWVKTTHMGHEVMAIGNFGGRVVDMIYDINGHNISPFSITNLMWTYQSVYQYQFVQLGKKEYKVRLNLEGDSFNKENELLEDVKKIVGEEAHVSIAYCNEIPVLASGKRRYIVNEMKL